ncbi:Phenylalanine--tRNA ligase beta subunit [bacterium HR32]|nr:Phenylalanine--tRNA ligase beta subunit [bacterium HR32]
MRVVVADPVVAHRVCLGVIEADGVLVLPSEESVVRDLEELAARVRERYAGRPPAEVEALQPARELYRRTGEDPTKTRPSSEALFRRALRGQRMSQVNSLVDLCNLCSLEFLLPIGLYDRDRLRGAVEVRLGRPGEAYASLGKGLFRAEGRLVVCDADGPFGSPTNDSARTAITERTRNVLLVVFAPASYPRRRMVEHTEVVATRLRTVVGAEDTRTEVLGGA